MLEIYNVTHHTTSQLSVTKFMKISNLLHENRFDKFINCVLGLAHINIYIYIYNAGVRGDKSQYVLRRSIIIHVFYFLCLVFFKDISCQTCIGDIGPHPCPIHCLINIYIIL